MTTTTPATHTPGPWRTVWHDGDKQVDIRSAKFVREAFPTSILIATMSDSNNRDEDARLIAAAPEMLEALQDLAQIAREYVAEGIPRLDAAIEKAAFVALKARGEVL